MLDLGLEEKFEFFKRAKSFKCQVVLVKNGPLRPYFLKRRGKSVNFLDLSELSAKEMEKMTF